MSLSSRFIQRCSPNPTWPTIAPPSPRNGSLRTQGKNNGVVLFIFIDDRKMHIATGYGLEGNLPDAVCKRIIAEQIQPAFEQKNYAEAIRNAINENGVAAAPNIDWNHPPLPAPPKHGRASSVFSIIFVIFVFGVVLVIIWFLLGMFASIFASMMLGIFYSDRKKRTSGLARSLMWVETRGVVSDSHSGKSSGKYIRSSGYSHAPSSSGLGSSLALSPALSGASVLGGLSGRFPEAVDLAPAAASAAAGHREVGKHESQTLHLVRRFRRHRKRHPRRRGQNLGRDPRLRHTAEMSRCACPSPQRHFEAALGIERPASATAFSSSSRRARKPSPSSAMKQSTRAAAKSSGPYFAMKCADI